MRRREFMGGALAAAAIARAQENYCDAGIAPGGKDSGSSSAGYVYRIDI